VEEKRIERRKERWLGGLFRGLGFRLVYKWSCGGDGDPTQIDDGERGEKISQQNMKMKADVRSTLAMSKPPQKPASKSVHLKQDKKAKKPATEGH